LIAFYYQYVAERNCLTRVKRDGDTVYVVELICDEFSRAPKKKAGESAAA